MNIAIFGGTFDPVHHGHLAVARAAAERFQLGRVYFVPADIPPHKQTQAITPYYHRYAMLALALAGEKNFVPSLLESPEIIQAEGKLASYSIDTVRRFKQRVRKVDRLFFIIGIDAFMDVAKWRSPVELLQECEFIVASRPGYSLNDVASALPETLRPAEQVSRLFKQQPAGGDIVLAGTTIHLLDEVKEAVGATKIRSAVATGRPIANFVGPEVAEYIRKLQLYKPGKPEPGNPEPNRLETLTVRTNGGQAEHRKQLHVVGGRSHRKNP
ncbi:MAG TPA: nicotinate-nucleotide adenylyltransferase [Clostridia bacterium]|nr:nicotinate-nucleotide adenylyltransferase [Clostridia bacterium]